MAWLVLAFALQCLVDDCPVPPRRLKDFDALAGEISKARQAVEGFSGKVEVDRQEDGEAFAWKGAIVGRKGEIVIDLGSMRIRHDGATMAVIDVDAETYSERAVNPAKPETWQMWSWLAYPVDASTVKAYDIGVSDDGTARKKSHESRPG